MIQDSGSRTEFESGAVRDIQEGKGRLDLLPMDALDGFFGYILDPKPILHKSIFGQIDMFYRKRNVTYIYQAIDQFLKEHNISYGDMVLELAIHYEEGAKKYAERNWEIGIPLHCYVSSGLRHYIKCSRGDSDERHDRAFLWNMFGLIWTYEHKPQCDDLPKYPLEVMESSKEVFDDLREKENPFSGVKCIHMDWVDCVGCEVVGCPLVDR